MATHLALLLALTSVGCGRRPTVVRSVEIDIPAVCAALVSENDDDGDGQLSEKELSKVPPINASFRDMDADNTGVVSLDELEARFEKVFNPKVGMLSAACRVTDHGKPLRGATVFFVPADYLQLDEATMPLAYGITSDRGVAQMEIHPDSLPEDAPKVRGLVRPGFYHVEVTLANGKAHSSQSVLGVEVSPETTIGGPINIRLD